MNTICDQEQEGPSRLNTTGIIEHSDGTFTVVTPTTSRNYKTRKGAERRLAQIIKDSEQWN